MANRNIRQIGQGLITEAVAYESAEIMRGNVFEVTHEFTTVTADGGTGEILIQPGGQNLLVGVITSKSTEQDLDAAAFEGPTVTEGEEGTGLTAFCTNRDVVNEAVATITYGPTVTADGDELPSYSLDLLTRYVLDGATNYLLRFTNGNASNAADISVKIVWSEPSE